MRTLSSNSPHLLRLLPPASFHLPPSTCLKNETRAEHAETLSPRTNPVPRLQSALVQAGLQVPRPAHGLQRCLTLSGKPPDLARHDQRQLERRWAPFDAATTASEECVLQWPQGVRAAQPDRARRSCRSQRLGQTSLSQHVSPGGQEAGLRLSY